MPAYRVRFLVEFIRQDAEEAIDEITAEIVGTWGVSSVAYGDLEVIDADAKMEDEDEEL